MMSSRKTEIETTSKTLLADVFTPVGIYLRLRDRYRDTILLESTDFHAAENSYSFICINAIAGIEIRTKQLAEYKLPGQPAQKIMIKNDSVTDLLWDFLQRFNFKEEPDKNAKYAQGLFGYTSFEAIQFFDTVKFGKQQTAEEPIPLVRYRLYQYVIAINHFKDELFICENKTEGVNSDVDQIESIILNKDVPVYPFFIKGDERSDLSDEQYKDLVKKGISDCHRGDVFQIVLSRRFQQAFAGDEFNVYRALRNINPSPYLFFFDYGDYKLMGSSPESQLIISGGKATLHPIAGTFKRTGNEETDKASALRLLNDPKENAEHVMLVDLARNDLSHVCTDVELKHYREVQYFSHVIHLVSQVCGKLKPGQNPFEVLGKTFPAGTLSGAPKFKALELINNYEPNERGFYGGSIGFIGADGSCNHAIMIRSFLSRRNTLTYQAGAGIVAASEPENELQEVNNKLEALKKAVKAAALIT